MQELDLDSLIVRHRFPVQCRVLLHRQRDLHLVDLGTQHVLALLPLDLLVYIFEGPHRVNLLSGVLDHDLSLGLVGYILTELPPIWASTFLLNAVRSF